MSEPPASKPVPAGVVVAVAIAVAALVVLGPRWLARPHPLVGKPAPDFSLELVNQGQRDRLQLSALRGKPVVLDFWASWCGPCQLETPVLQRLATRLADRGVTIVGVNTGDEPGMAAAFVRKLGVTYPIVFDAGDRVAAAYRVSGLPTLVVVDARGNVTAVRTGFEDDAQLEALISQAN